jgi:hypothetical protein
VATPTLIPTQASHTANWTPTNPDAQSSPHMLALTQHAGTVTGLIHVSKPGRYRVWLEGSLTQPVAVWVGRRLVGTISDEIGPPGDFLHVGTVSLAAGDQPVQLMRSGTDLGPVNTEPGDVLGPLTLEPSQYPPPVGEIAPDRARSLCGQPLEWIEIVR